MLTNWIHNLFILCLFLFSQLSYSGQQLDSLKHIRNSKNVVDEYIKLHKHFKKLMCSKGEDHKYGKLMKEYRGAGYFIPVINEDELDVKTITELLPLIKEKEKWIISQAKELKRLKSFKEINRLKDKLETSIRKLLRYKEEFYHNKSREKKELTKIKSAEEMGRFETYFDELVKKIPFLLSFRFPVNHFELRKEYDLFKGSDDEEKKSRANRVYFLRQIIQDGAQNPNRTRYDRFSRANADSLTIKMQNNDLAFVSEDIRYDMFGFFRYLDRQVKRGKKRLLIRMEEWRKRTYRTHKFYAGMLRNEKNKALEKKNKQMLKKLSKTKFELKDYTLKQQQKVYLFWYRQSELMRALYTLETILFNEVGSVDSEEGLERKDVAQVAINRTKVPRYSIMDEDDALFPYLEKKLEDEVIKEAHWLNVLFKTGEFSFTYYFIYGSVHVYCPDMSRRGRALRNENLYIALSLLRKPNIGFKALRYFSRASMLGRIDMTPLWGEGYTPVPERPGVKAPDQKLLSKLYRRKEYEYYYTFTDQHQRSFDVVEIKDKVYVLKTYQSKLTFYKYRNRHYFKYFTEKDRL